MKIGILTMYYGNISHGGLLQAYSLQKVLEEYGYDSQVISYDYNFQKRPWFRVMAHNLKKIPYYLLCVRYGDKTDKKYKEYANMISHSKYYIKNTISQIGEEYDVIIVGSDQVWNDDYCDEVFYLPFVKDIRKKVAYAASVGKDNLSEQQIRDIVEKISSFSAVSVRESNLHEVLQNNTEKSVAYVCDPTLLHDQSFWSKHASEKIINKRYVLLYTLSSNEQIIKSATEFAKKHDLSVVTVPNVNCNMKKKDAVSGNIQAWSIGPQEFLRLIMDSEYVITDSFHCTVFSLIFNKEIYCFDRENSGAPMNSRLKSLLGYCGIDNRFVKIDYVPKCDVSECIDYSIVNKRLSEFRNESLEWLKSTCKNI